MGGGSVRHKRWFSATVTLVALLLTACNRAQAVPQQYGEAQPLVEEARSQLTEQLDVDPGRIEIEIGRAHV